MKTLALLVALLFTVATLACSGDKTSMETDSSPVMTVVDTSE